MISDGFRLLNSEIGNDHRVIEAIIKGGYKFSSP